MHEFFLERCWIEHVWQDFLGAVVRQEDMNIRIYIVPFCQNVGQRHQSLTSRSCRTIPMQWHGCWRLGGVTRQDVVVSSQRGSSSSPGFSTMCLGIVSAARAARPTALSVTLPLVNQSTCRNDTRSSAMKPQRDTRWRWKHIMPIRITSQWALVWTLQVRVKGYQFFIFLLWNSTAESMFFHVKWLLMRLLCSVSFMIQCHPYSHTLCSSATRWCHWTVAWIT